MALVNLMQRKGFYVIRCSSCGRYTYAPIKQKTRLCVSCQRIIKVNPLNAVYVEEAGTARTRVKFYQTGKHHKEFMTAVEQSRDKVTALIPTEKVELEQLEDSGPELHTASTRRRMLEKILHRIARDTPVDLNMLEKESEKEGLPWEWVLHQLEKLIRAGHLICPKPWQVRLVTEEPEISHKSQIKMSPTTLARRIGEIIHNAKTPISYTQIHHELEKESISTIHLDDALEKLRMQGYILKTSKGTFRWTGD
jgi:hypothetical protein